MSKRVLWLDNDPSYINVYVKMLKNQPDPYDVTLVSTLTEAQQHLQTGKYDLLILDVMIPTMSEEEEKIYPPTETIQGLNMGLSFYKRNQKMLADSSTKVLVFTARIDKTIKDGFLNAGLSEENLVMKAEVGDVRDFIVKVQEVFDTE